MDAFFGTTIVALIFLVLAARATPNPWFPADEAITPSSNIFLGNELILDIAPLTLKEKVGCNSSLLNKMLFCRSADNNLAFSRGVLVATSYILFDKALFKISTSYFSTSGKSQIAIIIISDIKIMKIPIIF